MKKVDNFDAKKWLVENKITTQSRLNENEAPSNLSPLTKKKFDNLLVMAEKAVAEKDKETLQKIYNKALTTGHKGWAYFIESLYDKGLAYQDGAYLKWNLDESRLNEGIVSVPLSNLEWKLDPKVAKYANVTSAEEALSFIESLTDEELDNLYKWRLGFNIPQSQNEKIKNLLDEFRRNQDTLFGKNY